jgi:hypothetical protein
MRVDSRFSRDCRQLFGLPRVIPPSKGRGAESVEQLVQKHLQCSSRNWRREKTRQQSDRQGTTT